MPSSYSFSLQIKAVILAALISVSFYVLDNCGGRLPCFKNLEDYLQFVTPLYALFIVFLHNDMRSGLKQALLSLTSAMAVIYALKYFINAKRPNGVGGYSFPSGHTALAFASAALIHKRYHLYYAIPAYVNGALIGYLRVFHAKHHVIDVIGGAIVGALIVWKMVSRKDAALVQKS